MPPDDRSIQSKAPTTPTVRPALSPAAKKRLQSCFAHASKQMAQGNFDYATELLTPCVLGEPGNLIYLRSFVENLQKKYGNKKRGAWLTQIKEHGARSTLKKAEAQEKWDEVFRGGLQILQANPWDISTLRSMANAAGHSGDGECERYLLRCALDADPKDPETNIQCAQAAVEMERFDEAIACWRRVLQVRPNDPQSERAIAALAVQKTIKQGGYEDAGHGRKIKDSADAASPTVSTELRLSEEESLRRRIAEQPQVLAHYFELVQWYVSRNNFDAAEQLCVQAFEASHGDPAVRERWSEVEVRRLRYTVALADAKVKEGLPSDRNFLQLQQQLRAKEIEHYRLLADRYPNTPQYRYELAVHYAAAGQYNDAIREFQQSRNDPRLKGLCMLGLGRCFQAIKQYGLAKSHYESAIEEIPDRDMAHKKEALYLAGTLALDELEDIAVADKRLSALAAVDFAYKDVSTLLEKIARLRDAAGRSDDEES
jgi:tetratricopeptide (TPR) repeat protein